MKSLKQRSPDLFERAFAVREERQKKAPVEGSQGSSMSSTCSFDCC